MEKRSRVIFLLKAGGDASSIMLFWKKVKGDEDEVVIIGVLCFKLFGNTFKKGRSVKVLV